MNVINPISLWYWPKVLNNGLAENTVESSSESSRRMTGISVYSFNLKIIFLFSVKTELAEIINALIMKRDEVIINAALFTRSTGFSKYNVIARGTDAASINKNRNGKYEYLFLSLSKIILIQVFLSLYPFAGTE